MDRRAYWVWMQTAFGAGSYKPWFIFNRFEGGLQEFHENGPPLWNSLNYISEKEARILYTFSLENADFMLEANEKLGHEVITPECEKYPEALRNIFDPPAVLYIKGALPDVDNVPAIGVVGSRKCSDEGKKAALTIGYQLALDGAVVVSGGALGIDSAAHSGALQASGKTICVLGCGITSGYLISNYALRERISNSGALVTEYPLQTPVTSGTFQVRNRLISGLCCGTIVIEAKKRSGSLITAKHAKEQSRDVFAYPGQPGDEHFQGCRDLIDDGAKAVTSGEMILEEYLFRFHPLTRISNTEHKVVRTRVMSDYAQKSDELDISENARKILETLKDGAKHFSEIMEITGLTTAQIFSSITELELLDIISALPGRRFSIQ